jgi:exonuclease SbcD
MRILHFSDLHIGVENYGRVDPQTGLSTRLLDFLAALDEVVEYALAQQVDIVLLAGDVYKGRDPSQTQQREFAKRLTRLSEAGIPIFLLVGNHDLPNAANRATAVDIFPTLQVPNIYVGNSLQNYMVITREGPLQILAVPWPRRSGVLNREESRGLSIEDIRREIESRLTAAIAQRVEELNPEIPAILAGHVTINGATVGTERSMMLGQDHVLLASAVHRPQLDYVALGHIHKHQILRNQPKVVYSGSLQRIDFSEEGDEKGFCVIDLEPSNPQGKRVTKFQFETVQARPFVTIDIKLISGDPDPTDSVLRAIAKKDITDAVVRVRVSLPSEMNSQLHDSALYEALRPAHYIAAISREIEGGHRTRLGVDMAKELRPLHALRLYLDSRDTFPQRRDQLLTHAEDLLSEEPGETNS